MVIPASTIPVLDSLVRGRVRLDLRSTASDDRLHLVASSGSRAGWTERAACPTALTVDTPVEQRFHAMSALMDVLGGVINTARVHAALPVAARVAADLPNAEALDAVRAAASPSSPES